MVKRSKWIQMLFALMVTAAMAVSMLPLAVSAGSGKGPAVAVSIDGNGDMKSAYAAVAVALDSAPVVLTSTKFYEGSEFLYAVQTWSEEAYKMQYVGEFAGMALFAADADSLDAFYTSIEGAKQGQKYDLVGLNADGEAVKCTVKVTEISTQADKNGVYDIAIDDDSSDILSPAAIVEGNTLVGIRHGSRVISLKQPSGGSGGSDGGSGGGSDGGSGGGSGGGSDGGSGGGSGGGSDDGSGGGSGGSGSDSGGTPGRKSNTDKEEPKKSTIDTNTLLLIGGGIVVVVVLVLLKQKKKKPEPQPQPQPDPWRQPDNWTPPTPTMPVNPPRPVEPVIPGPAPAPRPVKLYLEIANGPMTGQQYPIPDSGKMLIGRSMEATIRYPADTKGVSRNHCQVYWNNGSLQVMDLGSTSGTFLRGKGQLVPNTPVALTDGSTIYLGSKSVAISVRTRTM